MQNLINNLPKLAKDKHKENKTFFAKLRKKPPKQLDYIMQELHEEEFERTGNTRALAAMCQLEFSILPEGIF